MSSLSCDDPAYQTTRYCVIKQYPTPVAGGQTIHPYSDYLLHDMGSEIMGVGLNDNYVSGLARGNEWRTTPLGELACKKRSTGILISYMTAVPAI